jgi:hypothetical protein
VLVEAPKKEPDEVVVFLAFQFLTLLKGWNVEKDESKLGNRVGHAYAMWQ